MQERRTAADVKAFRAWAKAFKKEGIPVNAAELSLVERTVVRVTSQTLKHQENREAIAAHAVQEFAALKVDPNGQNEIEPEWLARFWRLAEDVSSADFQSLWGRVLARQVSGENLSARFIDALSLMSRGEAELLERAAPITIRILTHEGPATFLFTSIVGHPPKELNEVWNLCQKRLVEMGYQPYRDILGPIGIVIESGFAFSADVPIVDGRFELAIGNSLFEVSGYKSDFASHHIGGGTRFTPVGTEIMSLLQKPPNRDLVDCLQTLFRMIGLSLKPLD